MRLSLGESLILNPAILNTSPAQSASVIDLFCGAGGMSHGFLLEGFKIASGYDLDANCRFPYEHNNHAAFYQKDIRDIQARDLIQEFSHDGSKILIGCAPCQPFSLYAQGRDNSQWRLLNDFADLAIQVLPDILLMENVPQLVRFQGGWVFNNFVNKLQGVGYQVKWTIADCIDFGVPQSRRRLILIASRHGTPELPEPKPASEQMTVRDAIADMPSLEAGEIHHSDSMHRASALSTLNLRRIRASIPGGTWRDWDNALLTDCHKRKTGKGYASVYGRMRWDMPAPTITTQFYGFGNGRFGHPEQDRAISLREGAILQTFPSDYAFVAENGAVEFKRLGRLIGNAVPVALAQAVARAVKRHLMG